MRTIAKYDYVTTYRHCSGFIDDMGNLQPLELEKGMLYVNSHWFFHRMGV